MPAKPVAAWTAAVLGLWLALGCESAVAPRPDATPDAAPDTAADVPVDVPVDADADAGWPPESPEQVNVTTRWTSSFTAYYPYVYYHFVEYNEVERQRETYLFAFHVKTFESKMIAHYHFTPQMEFLSVHEGGQAAFWIATEHYQTGLQMPEYRGIYHLMRLSLATHELTEVPTAGPFYTHNCERNNGIMHLYDYDPRTGWMVLCCQYVDEMLQRVDTWRANTITGKIEFLVNGVDRFAFFGDIPFNLMPGVLTGMTAAWEDRNGWIAQGPPFQYEVMDTGNKPSLVFQIEYPSNTMSSVSPMNREGWFTYCLLDEPRQLLKMRGINLWTFEELEFPEVSYNQFQGRMVHPDLPHLWVWLDAGTKLNYMGNAVMPGLTKSDIVLWDQERDIQRRVTAGDRRYTTAFLLPGEDPPRTLVYRSSDSHTENVRLHLRDLIAAGILDETGHLLPEP